MSVLVPWYLVVEVDPYGDPFLDGHRLFGPDKESADEFAATSNAGWDEERWVVCEVAPPASFAPRKNHASAG